jgi:O-antigen/teichoic acid export membrane protein
LDTASPRPAPSADTLLAARNGLKLFVSLLCTWGISIAVRFFLPRSLGPALFGSFNFADGMTATVFVLLTLGIDIYIRKDVAVRPDLATGFFGGLMAVRATMTLLLLGALTVAMSLTGRSPTERVLVYVLGGTQLFGMMNDSLSACLHAKGRVDGLSVVNVVSKLTWGLGIGVVLFFHWGLAAVAAAYLVPEVVKTVLLYVLAHEHLGLRFRIDVAGTKAALKASLPFYVNGAAIMAYNRLDVIILGYKTTPTEVGWYGAASNLALLTMIITPLIGWVMQPLLSKAAARSEAELTEMMRRSMELVLCLAIPVSLAIGVGGDVWIRLIFGEAFSPATLAMRILAPRFLLSYVSIFLSICLITVNRSWTLTLTSVAGLALNPLLNLSIIGPMRALVGPENGGAGAGCATAIILTELTVVSSMLYFIGKRVFDRRLLLRLLKTAAVCAVVIALDRFIVSLGPARLLLDAAAYIGLATLTGAVPFQEMGQFLRQAMKGRRGGEVA